jgi:protein PhnA
MSEEFPPCPKCKSIYTYTTGVLLMCPECGNEWNAEEAKEEEDSDELIIKDSNGNQLFDGDAVIVIKNLPVKGAPLPIKAGTKVKNIRLSTGDHNINCKIDGFGSMSLKSEFVKKA